MIEKKWKSIKKFANSLLRAKNKNLQKDRQLELSQLDRMSCATLLQYLYPILSETVFCFFLKIREMEEFDRKEIQEILNSLNVPEPMNQQSIHATFLICLKGEEISFDWFWKSIEKPWKRRLASWSSESSLVLRFSLKQQTPHRTKQPALQQQPFNLIVF